MKRRSYSKKTPWADEIGPLLAAELDAWIEKVEKELAQSVKSKTRNGKSKKRIVNTKNGEKITPYTERILSDSIFGKLHIRFGDITSVGFSFDKHGIYWVKGVSRKHPVGEPRDKVDWFSDVIEKHFPELEEIVTRHYADAVVKVFDMYIK